MDLELCRICCQNQGTKYVFTSDGDLSISNKLMYFCINVQLNEDDGLPDHICDVCEQDLSYCYLFVQKCEAGDKKVRANIASSAKCEQDCKSNINFIKEEEPSSFESHNSNSDDDNNENLLKPIKIKIETQLSNVVKPYKKLKEKQGKACQCSVCGQIYKNKSTLLIHMRSHKAEKPYECKTCDKKYRDSGSLKRHVERKHFQELRQRKFICETCGKGFYSKNDITIHIRIHTGETPYACPLCPKKFSQQSSLIRHEQRHSGVKPHPCSKCTKCFSSKDELKSHLRVHTTEKQYSCHICNGLFKYKNNLKKHLRLHVEGKSFVCNYCGRTFSAKGNLKIHIDSQHSEKSGQCRVCLKNVPNLEIHTRKHTGERPLKCELCSSTFFEQNGLAHHINFRHKNTNKYKCSYEGCAEMFPSQPMLEFHKAKQHGTHIPFPCDKCSRGFYRKNDLARHKIGTHKERLK